VKKLVNLIVLAILVMNSFAQSPLKMSYQAVIRNSSNLLITNTNVGFRISILRSSASGQLVYSQTFTPATNNAGLISVEFGGGSGFDTISWAYGPYFIKTEADPSGGNNYTITGTSQILSVPFALYAMNAANSNGIKFGSSNTYLGDNSFKANTVGSYNTSIGYQSLMKNSTGNSNVAIGESAMRFNTLGGLNVAVGSSAMYANTEGSNNVAVGFQCLSANTIGTYNTSVGIQAMKSNISGNSNAAYGDNSLNKNTIGNQNVALGSSALYNNTTGNYNTAVGFQSINTSSTAEYNTGIGYLAMKNTTTGGENTAVGVSALISNTIGFQNTGVGRDVLSLNTEGNRNAAFGWYALAANTIGNNNTALGYHAGQSNKTGSNNTMIGYDANVSADSLTNATAIGNQAIVNASDKIVIGNANAITVGGYGAWTNYSDRRLKENIIYTNKLGLNFISKLKTTSYNYIADSNKRRRDGLIAQDVQQSLNELGIEFSGMVIDNDKDKTMNLSYDSFVIPLINAVQEQQNDIDNQKKIIAEQQKQIDELRTLVNTLIIK
jgi:hypothetical protein